MTVKFTIWATVTRIDIIVEKVEPCPILGLKLFEFGN